jgi:hypothetical protein
MALPSALPEGWDSYGPGEKIDYFNTMGITPDDLMSVGIGQGDIDWMWNNGYNIGRPQPQPVTPVAPPTFNRPDSPRVIGGEPEEPVVFNPNPEPYQPPYQQPVVQQPVVDTRRNDINNLYQTLLGREGDAGGLDFWSGTGLSLNDIANYFKDTDEYRARNAPVVTQAPVTTPIVAATPQPIYNEDLTGDLVTRPGEGIFGLGNLLLPNVPGIDLRDTIGDTVDTSGGGAVAPVVSAAPITDYSNPNIITGAPITDYSGGSGSGYTDLGGYDDQSNGDNWDTSGWSGGGGVSVDTGLGNVYNEKGEGIGDIVGESGWQPDTGATTITYPETSRLDVPLETMAAGGGLNVGMGYSMQSPEAEKLGLNARTGENGVGNGYSDDRNQYLNNIQMTATDRDGNPITYQAVYDFASGQTTYRINVNGEVIESTTRPDVEGNILYIGDRGITLKETGPVDASVTVTATAEPVATVAPVITFAPPFPVITRPGFPETPEVTPEPTDTPETTPPTTLVPATPEATIEVTQEPEPTTIVPATPEPPVTTIEDTPIPETPVVTVAPPPPQTPVVTPVIETPAPTIVPETPVVTPIVETPVVTEIVPATPEATIEVTPKPTIVPETPMPTIVATPEVTIVPATPEVTPIVETLPPETPTVTATPGPTATKIVPATPEVTIIVETPGPSGTEIVPTTPEVTATPGPTATEIVPATPEVTTIVETPTPTPSETITTPPETTLVPATPEVTPTATPTATPTDSPTATPTATPTSTPTLPPETTLVPATPEVTDTPEPSVTIEESPTPEPSTTPEVSESPEPSPTPSPTPTETNEETPTPTPTPTTTVVVPPTPMPPTVPPTATPTTAPPTPTPTATTTKTGQGLPPGLIQAVDFYRTYSPVQAKFSWDQKPFQMGPEFNPVVAQSGKGSATPWGLQQMFKDLSYNDIMNIVSGRSAAPTVGKSAERIRPYDEAIASVKPVGQIEVNPRYGQQEKVGLKQTNMPTNTTVDKENANYKQVVATLGENWEEQQRRAAEAGDWATYYRIESIVNSIMNPTNTETGD